MATEAEVVAFDPGGWIAFLDGIGRAHGEGYRLVQVHGIVRSRTTRTRGWTTIYRPFTGLVRRLFNRRLAGDLPGCGRSWRPRTPEP